MSAMSVRLKWKEMKVGSLNYDLLVEVGSVYAEGEVVISDTGVGDMSAKDSSSSDSIFFLPPFLPSLRLFLPFLPFKEYTCRSFSSL
jgi:hypothetical protein